MLVTEQQWEARFTMFLELVPFVGVNMACSLAGSSKGPLWDRVTRRVDWRRRYEQTIGRAIRQVDDKRRPQAISEDQIACFLEVLPSVSAFMAYEISGIDPSTLKLYLRNRRQLAKQIYQIVHQPGRASRLSRSAKHYFRTYCSTTFPEAVRPYQRVPKALIVSELERCGSLHGALWAAKSQYHFQVGFAIAHMRFDNEFGRQVIEAKNEYRRRQQNVEYAAWSQALDPQMIAGLTAGERTVLREQKFLEYQQHAIYTHQANEHKYMVDRTQRQTFAQRHAITF